MIEQRKHDGTKRNIGVIGHSKQANEATDSVRSKEKCLAFFFKLNNYKPNIMKKLTVQPNEIAINRQDKTIKKIYTAGTYWIFPWATVEVFDINLPIEESLHGLFQNNQQLQSMVDYVEAAHNEAILVFVNKQFKTAYQNSNAMFWKETTQLKWEKHTLSSTEVVKNLQPQQLECLRQIGAIRNFCVPAFFEGLLFVNEQFIDVLKPGDYAFYKNETAIHVVIREIRTQTMEILGQEILTKDKAQLRINCMLHYQLTNFRKAYESNRDFEKSLYQTIQLGLREFIGGLSFDELMADKNSVSSFLIDQYRTSFQAIGIDIKEAGIKDIILPGDIREIMNKVLIAEKNAQANSIMRREETASTRSLLNTAKLMEENELLWKLKEMEYIEKVAEKVNSISISGGGNVLNELKTLFIKP